MSLKKYNGRFAPTPSGPLHFGSLVTALASYLDVKSLKGNWWLRIEDCDLNRVKDNSVNLIKTQLLDHGLNWDYWPDDKGGIDGILYQRNRNSFYLKYFYFLAQSNQIFGCKCTKKMIKEIYKKKNLR